MRLSRKYFLKGIRLVVFIWMGTMIGSLYFLEKVEHSRGRSARSKRTNSVAQNLLSGKCDSSSTFNGTFKENLEKLKTTVFSESLPWIRRLDSIPTKPRLPTSFPVFVTAANEKFFVRSQGLVKGIIDRLMPVYKRLKLIYFDIGLNSAQRDIMMYKEFGQVWWLDASARFVSRDLDLPLKYLKENRILFFTFDRTADIAARTDIRTFHYFNEDPCLYTNFGEVDASGIAFRKSRANDIILRLWLSCALDQNCIAPQNVTKYCETTMSTKSSVIGRCHRYDQSALGIILRRLYHKQNHYPLVEVPFRIIEIRRKEEIPFFIDPQNAEGEIRRQKGT